jgi:hypothetical protein
MKRIISSRKKNSIIILLILSFSSVLPISMLLFENNKSNTLSISLLNNNSTFDLSHLPAINQISWYNPKTEMLIISPNDSQFLSALEPLKEWRDSIGVKTQILANFSEYDGVDTPEKIRNMIKDFYERENIRWILLAGDAEESLIPIRLVYNPDTVLTGETEAVGSSTLKPTDFYYSTLSGSWDEDEDGLYGESEVYNDNGIDEITWVPDVYVGRLPADSANELSIMINKTLKYETDPFMGDWMNKMLLAGGISSYTPAEDEARLTEYIWQNYTASEMNFTHLTKTTSSFTPSVPPPPNLLNPLTATSFITEFNLGYSTVIIAGHGRPDLITDASGTRFYDNGDALSSSNVNMPSLFYADACTTSSFDIGDNSIGERLINRADAGAIGYIGGLRVTWYWDYDSYLEKLNRGNAKLFWEQFFEEKKFKQGQALFDSKVAYLESDFLTGGRSTIQYEWERKNVLTYNLLGDPIVDIYTKKPINAQNPFDGLYFSGQLINTTINDIQNNSVPYARVHFKSDDGKYHTVYADINGQAIIRLPDQSNENYSVVITGHNLIPTNFSFLTIPDTIQPEITNITFSPLKPTVSDNMKFKVKLEENESGVESLFLLVSTDNMKTYEYQQFHNSWDQNQNEFSFTLNKMKPNDYTMILVARDYCNNTVIGDQIIFFTVELPLSYIPLVVTLFLVIFLLGISCIIIYKGIKSYKVSTNS